jgi:hypothetical protein
VKTSRADREARAAWSRWAADASRRLRPSASGTHVAGELDIQPKFNVGLPDAWFVAAYAVESIQISFADDNKIFLPIDLIVGKKTAGNWVVSLDYSRELLHGRDDGRGRFDGPSAGLHRRRRRAGLGAASEAFGANVVADSDRAASGIAKQLSAIFGEQHWTR